MRSDAHGGSVTGKGGIGEHTVGAVDEVVGYRLGAERRCDGVLVEIGCRDRQTVAEVLQRGTLDLLEELLLLLRLRHQCFRFLQAFAGDGVGLTLADTDDVGVLADTLAEDAKQEQGDSERTGIE